MEKFIYVLAQESKGKTLYIHFDPKKSLYIIGNSLSNACRFDDLGAHRVLRDINNKPENIGCSPWKLHITS